MGGPSWEYHDLRRYAVGRLAQATDEDLQLYLMQLVQALKFESFEGDLARFLIERASANASLSNYLYWYLQVWYGEVTMRYPAACVDAA